MQADALRELSPAALKAAMTGGTDGWGQHGSALEHVRYMEPVEPRSRRRCWCGCGRRATHRGMANGLCMTTGCELHMARWVRDCLADWLRARLIAKEEQGHAE